MTSVLVVDSDNPGRLQLEQELQDSNQFSKVVSCAAFADAPSLVSAHQVEVVLISDSLLAQSKGLEKLKTQCPDLGYVLVKSGEKRSPADLIKSYGLHAQTCRHASPMEHMASVAKALVARVKRTEVQPVKMLRNLIKN